MMELPMYSDLINQNADAEAIMIALWMTSAISMLLAAAGVVLVRKMLKNHGS